MLERFERDKSVERSLNSVGALNFVTRALVMFSGVSNRLWLNVNTSHLVSGSVEQPRSVPTPAG
jgi:hypothetical protein